MSPDPGPRADADAHDGPHDDGHDHPHLEGLPLRHALLRPGSVVTGAVIAAVFAVVAQFRSVFAGLVWDDRVFLVEDARVQSLASVWRAFTEAFFTAEHPTEMYRPLVNASLAVDWFASGSSAGAPRTWWFHAVNLLLHALNAGLVYVLFANLTKRRLGAPLIAAVLFAVHPLAVEPVTWIVGRCDLLAAACGLGSAILLVRSPGKDRLLWASVALWGLGLFAKASIATLPLVVALALVAYHQVEPKRFLTMRLGRRFAAFAIPALVWFAARWGVLGAPFPVKSGRAWHDIGVGAALQGVGRAVWVQTAHVFVPVGLCGDYSADAAWTPGASPWDASSVLGLLLLAGVFAGGILLLRRHAAGFPLLGFGVALVPVLQIVPIGAILADRFLYLPMAFLLLLVAEGLEHLYYRWGAARGLSVTLLLFGVLPVMSHLRAGVWKDEVTFQRDVLANYPKSPDGTYHLAKSLSETGRADDRAEAIAMLRRATATFTRPDDELALLGALLLEDGALFDAEAALRRAIDVAGGKPRVGALARYNLAVCLKRTQRSGDPEMRRLLEEALRRAPDLVPARTLLDSLR